MPVVKKRLGPKRHPDHDQLVTEVVRHLRGGDGLPEYPKIVEEDVPLSKNFRVYVSWNDWASVSELERSEIILEAYQEARGVPDMLRISVAMGLTPLQAMQLGIDLDG